MARDAYDTDATSPQDKGRTSPEEQRPRSSARTLSEDSHASQCCTVDSDSLETVPLVSSLPESSCHHKSVCGAKVITALVVFAWFCSNIALLLMNKFLLSNYGFKQPVFLTLCHMLACVILSTAFSTTQYVPKKSIQSSKQLIKVSMLAAVFAMSVVLGNVSLRFIPVSFSQVCFCMFSVMHAERHAEVALHLLVQHAAESMHCRVSCKHASLSQLYALQCISQLVHARTKTSCGKSTFDLCRL